MSTRELSVSSAAAASLLSSEVWSDLHKLSYGAHCCWVSGNCLNRHSFSLGIGNYLGVSSWFSLDIFVIYTLSFFDRSFLFDTLFTYNIQTWPTLFVQSKPHVVFFKLFLVFLISHTFTLFLSYFSFFFKNFFLVKKGIFFSSSLILFTFSLVMVQTAVCRLIETKLVLFCGKDFITFYDFSFWKMIYTCIIMLDITQLTFLFLQITLPIFCFSCNMGGGHNNLGEERQGERERYNGDPCDE